MIKMNLYGAPAAAILLAMLAAAPAHAGALPELAAPAPNPPFGQSIAIDPAELAGIAGQADLNQTVQAQNSSTVSGNTVAGSSVTGVISFDAQAFQNMNGLSVLSANTGNNVAINSSLNVNVAVRP